MVIGIWKSSDHSRLESDLHQKHADDRINGEWFRFSKKQIDELFQLMKGETSIFRLGENADSVFAKFSNIEKDCPEGHTVRFKIKKMYGDFTPEQRNAIRIASMIEDARKRIASGKVISEGQRKALESAGLSCTSV